MSTATIIPLAGPDPYTEEWHALRLFDSGRTPPVVFGASEAAEAAGISPYSTPLELFLRKRGELPPREQTEAMEVGLLLEGPVLTLYEMRTGHKVRRKLPLYFHGEHNFVAATPDGVVIDPYGPDDWRRAVDAKTSTYRRYDQFADPESDKFGQHGTDQMPADYVLQAQQQMAVLGCERVDFPVLFDGRTLRIYSIPRDETLIAAIISAEKELAERIIANDPPEPHWTHPRTRECLQALHGVDEETIVTLSDEGYQRWIDITKRKSLIKKLTEANTEDTNRVLAEMGPAATARFPLEDREIHRSVVLESMWTDEDIAELAARVGQVKRKRYEMIRERRTKKTRKE